MVHEAQEREERLPLEAAEEPAAGVEEVLGVGRFVQPHLPFVSILFLLLVPFVSILAAPSRLARGRVLRVAHGLRPERDWQQDIQRLLRGVGALVLVHPQQLPAHVAHGPVDRHRELVHVADAEQVSHAVQTESTQDVGERMQDVSDVAREPEGVLVASLRRGVSLARDVELRGVRGFRHETHRAFCQPFLRPRAPGGFPPRDADKGSKPQRGFVPSLARRDGGRHRAHDPRDHVQVIVSGEELSKRTRRRTRGALSLVTSPAPRGFLLSDVAVG